MLHIILDTVVDIWNKTYIKLPTFQLEILRITKKLLIQLTQKDSTVSKVSAQSYIHTRADLGGGCKGCTPPLPT